MRACSAGTPSTIAKSRRGLTAPPARRAAYSGPVSRGRIADRGARLHRHAGDTLHPGVELDDMRRPGKGRGGGYVVTDVAVENDVSAVLPGRRRGRLGGGERMGTAGNTW